MSFGTTITAGPVTWVIGRKWGFGYVIARSRSGVSA